MVKGIFKDSDFFLLAKSPCHIVIVWHLAAVVSYHSCMLCRKD